MAGLPEGFRPVEDSQAIDERLRAVEAIDSIVTPTMIVSALEALHNATAPSGTVLYTRTPVISEVLDGSKYGSIPLEARHLGTRSPSLLLSKPKNVWFSAHSDQIGYVPPFTNSDSFDLTPIAAHKPKDPDEGKDYPEFPASVLRFVPGHRSGKGRYEVVSTGVIGTHKIKEKQQDGSEKTKAGNPYYVTRGERPRGGFHPGYDRIAYTPAFKFDKRSGLIEANNDNAAGLAATLVALEALQAIAKLRRIQVEDMGFGIIFPDEEEGLPESSAYFSREARRIGNFTEWHEMPEYVIEVDGHDTLGDEDPGPFATLGSVVSNGKGAIVPPDSYAVVDGLLRHVSEAQDQLDLELRPLDIRPTEKGNGTVSRSNDAAWMEFSGQVIPVGYMGRDPHHNKGISTTNVRGLVNTAKAIALIGAYANRL